FPPNTERRAVDNDVYVNRWATSLSGQRVTLEDFPRRVRNGRPAIRGVAVENVAAVDGAQRDVRSACALRVGLANARRNRDGSGALVKETPFIEGGLCALEMPRERHAAVVRNQVVVETAEGDDGHGDRRLARREDGGARNRGDGREHVGRLASQPIG